MNYCKIFNSFFKGGTLAYIISIFVIIISLTTTIQYIYSENEQFEELKTYLRLSIFVVIILINGIHKSSFIFIVFTDRIQNAIFTCWAIHSLGFVLFFLNMLHSEEMFNYLNLSDLVFRLIFYSILVSNSIIFLIFTMFSLLVSFALVSCPGMIQRFPRINIFMERIMNELNGFGENDNYNELTRPLNDVELQEVKSEIFQERLSGVSCSVCFSDILSNERVVNMKYCRHVFHSDCIKKWMKVKPECPICRKNVRGFDVERDIV